MVGMFGGLRFRAQGCLGAEGHQMSHSFAVTVVRGVAFPVPTVTVRGNDST